MSQSSENNLLRFGCPACGIRLVVDQSIAGTEGPCPSCGARIIAPPLEVEYTLVEKQAAPVAIKPRGVAESNPDPISTSTPREADASSSLESVSRPMSRSRSVNPTTALSEKHREKQNIKAFLKMLLAAIVVAAIALAVYYVLKGMK